MSDKTHIRRQSPESILDANPKVSKSVVADYNRLLRELKKLGVEPECTGAQYTLDPPLGRAIPRTPRKTPAAAYDNAVPQGGVLWKPRRN